MRNMVGDKEEMFVTGKNGIDVVTSGSRVLRLEFSIRCEFLELETWTMGWSFFFLSIFVLFFLFGCAKSSLRCTDFL